LPSRPRPAEGFEQHEVLVTHRAIGEHRAQLNIEHLVHTRLGVAQLGLNMRFNAVEVFEQHFCDLMSITLIIAAPALVVMFVIDLALGLVNRYAPQLNLISVSMSHKSLVGIVVWIAVFATLVSAFSHQLARLQAAGASSAKPPGVDPCAPAASKSAAPYVL
jgi:hypothetical protein